MNEFDLIRRYFTHSAPAAVLGVGDDAAILRPTAGHDLHVSADMLVSGRHFFADVDPEALGHKTLAVNLSDMAAMGATPRWALLTLALPQLDEDWVAAFARGFFALAAEHGVSVVGGDTTRGPLTLSVTIMGETPQGQGLRRDGARAGDDIWVSGQLGLAAAALQQRLGKLPDIALPADCLCQLERPQPRVALGQQLLGIAHAALDVSDGFAADLSHILARSHCGAEVWLDALPTHPALQPHRASLLSCIAAGGDDYELCFTAAPERAAEVEAAAVVAGVGVHKVGRITTAPGLSLLAADGGQVQLERLGYDHFN
ncbi:thiamine-phosphate kinase [Vogesella oryzae]|uniref:thiamine-phosphate kinase n=1 Tax=Vogesella oryzae TaxID=1735285 RepID=UPI001583AA48|nr:thiamine-phosphate kinase [Vogesella oryzae]